MSELTPAERYAAFRERSERIDDFAERRPFDLDPYQREAIVALDRGSSVLVAAPTGAGKTVVAEFAIHCALGTASTKLFYTAPMKALSNQKFHEFQELYGEENVGLLTGDSSVNPHARIVVMTTEVLRNMLYADSELLRDLGYVVMDEVHYLADRFRGAVWEEVIIHLPARVALVALSATVSNAEEFGDWLQTVRGETAVIVSEHRPVPLTQHALVGSRLVPLFAEGEDPAEMGVNPELLRLAERPGRPSSRGRGNQRGRGRERYPHRAAPAITRMDRWKIVQMLDDANLLPAIFFIFSRNGCDQAVEQVLRSGLRLTTQEEREEIRRVIDSHNHGLDDADLAVLGYWAWRDGLERGVAAHHAGLLPIFKATVEELFQRRLLKVVFATETLALGVNMPARSVVIERMDKYNGEARVPITAGEYTQLTGRAGRRGIDPEGHSVIQWREGMDPRQVASLASRRSYPLRSSFRPSYNMAVNLIEQFGRARTRTFLESSFAQFQADRSVVGLARKLREQRESLAGYAEAMQCDRGDFAEYAALRRELSRAERTAAGEHRSRGKREALYERIDRLKRQLSAHSAHRCPDREKHARWAERWAKLDRESSQIAREIAERTGRVVATFDRVVAVLEQLDYLAPAESGGELSASAVGRTLARIHGERDLLVAESLRLGHWSELDPPAMAAMAACLVFENRRDEEVDPRDLPRGPFLTALDATERLWAELDDVERAHGLPGTEPLATGLAAGIYRWARGGALDQSLYESGLAAGDFVRWSKQVIDLLDQISVVASGETGRAARAALDLVRRGIVAHGSL